jgi:hypothetical protein
MYMTHQAVTPQRLRRFGDTNWSLAAAPFTTTPFAEIGRRPAVTLTLSAATDGTGRTATASGATFEPSDVGRGILYEAGIFVITGYTSSTVVTGDITIAFASVDVPAGWLMESSPQTTCTPSAATPVGAAITLTLTAAGWRSAEDVGKFVRLNGGLCKITGVTSTTIVNATIVKELSGTTGAPALSWSLEAAVWNATDGYPKTATLHQQRLVLAGSAGYPQTIWGSRTAEPLDFQIGTDDSEAYSFTISSDENNQIAYLTTARDLMALTYGAEYSLRGGIEKPITPTNVAIKPESNHGCTGVRPLQVKRDALFIQRAGKKVRALGYRYDFDGYAAPDLIALAEHLCGTADDGAQLSIIDMTYQQEPESLAWFVRSDGKLLSCTLDREQEVGVTGWALHDVGGVVESVCTVPNDSADVLYLLVKRTVAGSTVRYVERMEMTTTSTKASEKNLAQLDCAVFLYNASGATVWTHPTLVNTAVEVLADGNYMGKFTTNGSGQVTLPRTAYSVQIGLAFRATVVPVTPETGTGSGVAAGQSMATHKIIASFLNTGPCLINGQRLTFQKFGAGLLDAPIPLFTGTQRVSETGWEEGSSDIPIERDLPFPFHLRAVIRDFTANQG